MQAIQKMRFLQNANIRSINRWGLITFIALYALITSLLTFYIAYQNSAPAIFDIYFGFGELTYSLQRYNTYSSNSGFWTGHRMPLIPYFLTLVSNLSINTLFVLIIKNFTMFLFSGSAFYLIWRKSANVPSWIFFVILIYLNSFPYFVLYSSMLDTEEGYLVHFLALLFVNFFFFDAFNISRYQGKLLLVAMLTTALFLTKSSMLLTSVLFCVAFYFRSGKNLRVLFIFTSILACGILLWCMMNWTHSGVFTISTSWDGWNLYKGNNVQVLSIYPSYSLDTLDHSGWIPSAEDVYGNEWEANQAYIDKALDFILSEPLEAIQLISVKSYIFFLEVRKIPIHPQRAVVGSLSAISLFIFRILFFFAIFIGLKMFVQQQWHSVKHSNEFTVNVITYLTFLIVYATPYVIGFAYTRHIIPIIIPTIFFLIYVVNHKQASRIAQMNA